MALFKINRGKDADLPEVKHDGWAYFCTDSGAFYIDYADEDGNLFRKRINPVYTFSQVQADWNENDETLASYIKNKPDLETIELDIEWIKKALDSKIDKNGDAILNGTLSVHGDLHVKGTTYTVNAETLTVNDNLIMVQGQNQAMTGIIADNGLTRSVLKAGTKIFVSDVTKMPASAEKNLLPKIDFANENYKSFSLGLIEVEMFYPEDWEQESTKVTCSELEYWAFFDSFGNPSYKECYLSGNWTLKFFYNFEDQLDTYFYCGGMASYKFTFLQDVVLDDAIINFLKDSGMVIEEGGFEETRMSMASPVLVGDTLKIGEGIAVKDVNGNIVSFEFNDGAAQSLATREDNIPHGAILSWDANKNTIVEGTNIDHPLEAAEGENSIKSKRPEGDSNANFAYGADSMAIGKGATTTGDRAIALGRNVKSGGNASFVIGQNNIADNGRTEDENKWTAPLTDEEESYSANVAFVGGRNNTARGDATFMFGVGNTEFEKGNTTFVVGQENAVNKQTQSAILGSTNSVGKGIYNYIIGHGNITNADNTNETSDVLMLGCYLENGSDSGKTILGKLNKSISGNTFELGDGIGNYRHNLIEGKSYINGGSFFNSMTINAQKLNLNSTTISIPSSAGQEDWLQIKDNGNHVINIAANATSGLSISNTDKPISVISGALDLYANKGMTFRTHGAIPYSLKITSGMDNTIETGNRATFIANGRMRALMAPTAENDVVRLGDITKLLKVVEGLTDAQLDALNNFAKSLKEGN